MYPQPVGGLNQPSCRLPGDLALFQITEALLQAPANGYKPSTDYLVTFFLPATVLRLPFLVRLLVRVR